MISGYATSEGTKNFSKNSQVNLENFKIFEDLHLSNVGIGTYLGNPDSQTDELVKNAVKQSVLSGVNVIDTAINYRAQKAERSVGKAISELIQEEKINRNQIFVSSKNGYVTNDADIKEDFMQYVMRELGKPGIVKEGDITSGYHCMTTSYLSDQLDRSLKNLDLECIDLMYLHNGIEGQINDISKEQFLEKLKSVFFNVVDMMIETAGAEEAVKVAYKLSQRGDTVLLSPACASFDLFENYQDRGRQFKDAVRNL